MAFEIFGFKIGKIEDEVKEAISIPSLYQSLTKMAQSKLLRVDHMAHILT
jgi:hypothetical protein